ncbi:TlpA family protein disulfide reductase, partial [Micromonospora echinofusca]
PATLPALDLPCFTDGSTVTLAGLRGPAVVNLWASWCAPCRDELPAFQRLAERTAGTLHVVGVNSRDGREAARSVGLDLGLTFPTLADPQEQLSRQLGRNALPLTLFVDGQGRIRHLDSSGALDDATLTGLVRQHLGVVSG